MKYHRGGIWKIKYQLRRMDDRTKETVNLDAEAMNALVCALNKEEFNRVQQPRQDIKFDKYYR